MASTKKIVGPGRVLDRAARKGKLAISFDPSPDAFVTECRREKGRLTLLIVPGDGEIDPIEIGVKPKVWAFKFEDAAIPSARLADLEALITEEQDVHCSLVWTPEAGLFEGPGDKPAPVAEPEAVEQEGVENEVIGPFHWKALGARLTLEVRWSAGATIGDGGGDAWQISVALTIPNDEYQGRVGSEYAAWPSRAAALTDAGARLCDWLEDHETYDRKRALALQQKINAVIGKAIGST